MTSRVEIPPNLRNKNFRFVKIPAGKKHPIEKSWQKENNYKWNDPNFQQHLENGGNYGVVGGYGDLVIIDADDPRVEKAVGENLPKTFTVRTGGGGLHFYYRCVDLEKPIRLKDDVAGDLGDIQSKGKQVVGPSSIHPNGKKYEVEDDLPIADVLAEQIRFTLTPFMVDESEKVAKEERTKLEKEGITSEISITDVVSLAGLKRSEEEYQGSHPIHGSSTGGNFCVNPRKNVWHCFRHGTGGGPLSWLAVEEGIISCSEAVKGTLRGRKFARVLEKARKRGLISKEDLEEEPEISKYFEKGKFIPKLLAEAIMEDFHFITLEDTEEIYVYQDGVYRLNGEQQIKSEARARLGKHSKRYYRNEVVSQIQATTYTPRTKLNKNPHVIVVKNGILNVKNQELKSHTPNPPSTIKIPVKYNPEAECPKVENFLSEVLKKEDVPVIQEFVGYCLLKEHRFHKAIMLTGGGANGKTTFLNLVRKLLGRENVASASLHDLIYNRFAKADLYSKLANIHADIPDYALKMTGPFKMLTGEDLIYAEKKHKDAFHFENFAKLLFSANEIPETKDKSRAFFRRWLIIEFPYKFTSEVGDGNKDKDPGILEKITSEKELSGFLNWALEGLERLLENNDFSTELTVEERADIWEEMSDPIIAFKEAELVVKSNIYGTKDEIYNAYAQFCHKKNTPPLDKNVFSRELPKRLPVDTYRPRIDGRKTWCWKGLSLKDDIRVVQAVQDVSYNKGKYENTNVSNTVYDIKSIPDRLDQPGAKKRVEEILRLLKRFGGKTPVEIADKLSMQLKNVEKILEVLFNAGVVERKQEKLGGGKIYNIVREVDSCPSVSDIKNRLWKAFGVRPFKQSELFKHFSENELERVNNVISKMKENGEIRLVPMESGITVWELTPKE